jgi:peptide/nickel transport system substrate-binding protein
VDVTADDGAGTVTVSLSEPHSEVLPGLAMPQAGIVCPAGLEDTEALAAGTATGAFSGPYALTDANTGVRYSFELHEDYDGWPQYSEPVEGTPARTLEFVVGADEAVANQLLTGEIDVAAVDAEEVARFEGDDAYEATVAVTGEYYIMFNHKEGRPFADEDMRRAAAQVIDRTALRDVIDPAGDVITTLGDAKTACAVDDESLLVEQDPDAAAELLDGTEINIVGANAIGKNGAGTVYLQERLTSAGADVDLTNTDIGSWVNQVYEEPDTWDMTLYATVNNLGTLSWGMSTVLGEWYSDGGRNVTYTDNDAAADALEAALTADNEEQMCDEYRAAQEAALEEVDFVPVSMVTKTLISRDGYSIQVPGGREDYTTLRVG